MTEIANILEAGPTFSYEFFPPRNEVQAAVLESAIRELAITNPDFISITYGAMGRTRDITREIAIDNNHLWGFPTMAHLTCVGQSRDEILDSIDTYAIEGVENILALRGDGEAPGDFEHAIELVSIIKYHYPNMSVGVAAHPEVHPDSPGRKQDREYLAAKLGVADFAITQFFFHADDYRRLIEELDELGINKPVIPGIMLFASVPGLTKMANLNNTALPMALTEKLEVFDSPADIGKIAVEAAAQLIDDLSDYDVPGLHIYTMNRSQPALQLKKLLDSKTVAYTALGQHSPN